VWEKKEIGIYIYLYMLVSILFFSKFPFKNGTAALSFLKESFAAVGYASINLIFKRNCYIFFESIRLVNDIFIL